MSVELLPKGTPLGLCDTNGTEFTVGCQVTRTTGCNEETHGSWVVYEVKLIGTTPILSYFLSEMGQVLPVGYTAGILANEYDHKAFVFSKDPRSLRPQEDLFIGYTSGMRATL